jgi:hypothetical protein
MKTKWEHLVKAKWNVRAYYENNNEAKIWEQNETLEYRMKGKWGLTTTLKAIGKRSMQKEKAKKGECHHKFTNNWQ